MDLIPKDAQIKWLSEMSNILCDIPEEFKTDEVSILVLTISIWSVCV